MTTSQHQPPRDDQPSQHEPTVHEPTLPDQAAAGDQPVGDHPAGDHPAGDQPPSRRFTIAFTAAMIVIALGWAWLWQARTERIVVGPAPVLAVAGIVLDTSITAARQSTDVARYNGARENGARADEARAGGAMAGDAPAGDAPAGGAEEAMAPGVTAGVTAGVVSDMLAVGIQRTGVPVIGTAQLYAISGGRSTGAALVEAAREAGATQVVQGELRLRPDGLYELETRRVDARTRDLVTMLRTRGADVTEVVDRMTAQVAMSLGLRVPDGSVGDAMTYSLAAYVAYEAALRALHAGDTATALSHLDHALRADPSFGMARRLLESHRPSQ
jgi:hypothetical protein